MHRYTLFACSMDGTIAAVRLSPDELGAPITSDEQSAMLTKLYGKCFVCSAVADMSA